MIFFSCWGPENFRHFISPVVPKMFSVLPKISKPFLSEDWPWLLWDAQLSSLCKAYANPGRITQGSSSTSSCIQQGSKAPKLPRGSLAAAGLLLIKDIEVCAGDPRRTLFGAALWA